MIASGTELPKVYALTSRLLVGVNLYQTVLSSEMQPWSSPDSIVAPAALAVSRNASSGSVTMRASMKSSLGGAGTGVAVGVGVGVGVRKSQTSLLSASRHAWPSLQRYWSSVGVLPPPPPTATVADRQRTWRNPSGV